MIEQLQSLSNLGTLSQADGVRRLADAVCRPLVPGQGVRPRVLVTAARLPAQVHFLLRVLEVRVAVLVEVVLAPEPLLAHVARVRLVAAVDAAVACEFLVAREGARTGPALVWSVPCVNPNVPGKLSVVEERHTAESALQAPHPDRSKGRVGGRSESHRRCGQQTSSASRAPPGSNLRGLARERPP